MNTITLAGNLTRDPEIRYTREGRAATTFGLAVNRRTKNTETQESDEAVSFFDVVSSGEIAENVALTLITRGSQRS